jgi:probable DNA metabolism protein
MPTIVIDDHYRAWRSAALEALAAGRPPETLTWRLEQDGQAQALQGQASLDYAHGIDDMSGNASPVALNSGVTAPIHISKDLSALMQEAALFRDPQRWAFLYKVLWRWTQGDRAVASAADEDGARLSRMARAVRRDKHDMIAYVRFRKQPQEAGRPEYLAWYAPDHDVLAWAADHFAQRMGRASWMIATPGGAACWDGSTLHLRRERALEADHAPACADDAEALWLVYYRSTFNPARLNEAVLEQQMPVRFWKGLPEGAMIPGMVSAARNGAQCVAQAATVGARKGKSIAVDAGQAQPVRDQPSSLDACRRCDLWRNATQAVPGVGPHRARIMVIGEQPGDQEDLAGQPFVGPAGQLLDDAMHRAGVARTDIYLTNAVKHFKWGPRGKRRLHKTPAQREVEACYYWLEKELDSIKPAVIVTLGATALSALLRQKSALQDYIDAPFDVEGMPAIATYHPSFALRQRDHAERERIVDAIAAALKQARDLIK